jgi:glycerol-3-phosphate dehydrogenase
MLSRVEAEKLWDIIIIGGGCSGVGCAVDAASRGFKVLLLEASDFGKGTSSRSTKLIHGGIRYLKSGQMKLVKEALKEREILISNAPHVVRNLSFLVPCRSFFEIAFYGAGLSIYDLLARSTRFKKVRFVSHPNLMRDFSALRADRFAGGWIYEDAQFDDARLLINLVRTAVDKGATVLNYSRVFTLIKDANGIVEGVKFVDEESGKLISVRAKIIINATGVFCDQIRRMSDPQVDEIVMPSQGIHLVLRKSFCPIDSAILIPKTRDKRVIFLIPWNGRILVGTTDTPIQRIEIEPTALHEEIQYLLTILEQYLKKVPATEDILSVFAGIRPLVKQGNKPTSQISRDFLIEVDKNKLITLTGGKWTTYRLMAQKTIDFAIKIGNLPFKESRTRELKIHGWQNTSSIYGSDIDGISKLIASDPCLSEKLSEDLPYTKAETIWAVRYEMARNIEDVLCRRTRALFLDSRATLEIAPKVARLMAKELGKAATWELEQISKFQQIARKFLVQEV